MNARPSWWYRAQLSTRKRLLQRVINTTLAERHRLDDEIRDWVRELEQVERAIALERGDFGVTKA